jgi:hypothetical protein
MKPTSHSREIKEVRVNKQKAGKKLIKNLISAFNDSSVLTEKGGFLFKVTLTKNLLHIGVIPNFINNQRTYHYDIEIGVENEFTIIGGISNQGVFNLLFKPKSSPLSPEKKEEYCRVYTVFARFLVENGLNGTGKLDWITNNLLEESRIFSRPITSVIDLIE